MKRDLAVGISLVLMMQILVGCSSMGQDRAWVIGRWENGGVIGYRGSDDNIMNQVADKVHCKNFRIVKHVFKAQRVPKDYYYDYLRDYNTKAQEIAQENAREYRYYSRLPASEEPGMQGRSQSKSNYAYYDNYYNDRYWRELTYQCYFNPRLDYDSTRFNDTAVSSPDMDDDYNFYRP